MNWTKLGRIFSVDGTIDWMQTHAAFPAAMHLTGDVWRVYFSPRDAKGRSQIGYFEIDLFQPTEPLFLTESPVIPLGPLGAFDDNGVTSSCNFEHDGLIYHYYNGWTLGATVPFRDFIGCAVSRDGGKSFDKVSPAPVLGMGPHDPYLTGSPSILIEAGIWRMWYVSGVRWELQGGKPKHYYHIKYAESTDGIEWRRTGHVCIDFDSPDEYAIATPRVVKEGDLYRMWYCSRGSAYRLGYAESHDGLSWTRKDAEAGLEASPSGWDSEMIAYPCPFRHGGKRFMLYNGNSYGRTGIGLAVMA